MPLEVSGCLLATRQILWSRLYSMKDFQRRQNVHMASPARRIRDESWL